MRVRPGSATIALAAFLSVSPALADIVIGTAGPMTGTFAIFGEQMRRGAEQAVADINAAGGVLGQPLTLTVGDDLCDRKEADAIANQMTGRKIALMAGHLCSGASIAAATVYAEAGIVQISPGATNPRYTDERAGPGVFRLAGRDDRQGAAAADFIATRFKGKRVAILHDEGAYGKALADDVERALAATGIKPIFTDTYESGGKEYGALAARLKDARIDAVFVGGMPTEAGLIARAMRDVATRTALVGGDALLADDFWLASGSAGEGAFVSYPPDPSRSPDAASLVAKFRAAGVEPEGFVLPTYAAIQIWAAAAATVGALDGPKVAAAIAEGTFDTVLGKVSFDEKGDADLPSFVIYEWKFGRYDYLGN
jgi:branched-chain amino acid transport system substrate-binding protein